MQPILRRLLFLWTVVVLPSVLAASADAAKSPKFLVILVDDMGYSDPGFMGGEIETPRLDRVHGDLRRV